MSNLATTGTAELQGLPKEQERSRRLTQLAQLVSSKPEDSIEISKGEEISLYGLQKSISPASIFDYPLMYKGYRDKGALKKIITAAVIWFVEGFKEGGAIRTTDILRFSDYLFEFKYDTLEDILLCFRMAEERKLKDPETGKVIERYSAMSYEILVRYWTAYLNYKADLREANARREKQRLTGGDFRTEEDTAIMRHEKPKEAQIEPRTSKEMISEIQKGLDPFEKSRQDRLKT